MSRDQLAAALPGWIANLFRMMRAYGLDPATAEDVVQQTCLVALERAGQYRGDGPLFAWVARIAYRLAARVDRPVAPLDDLDPTCQAPPAAELIASEATARLEAAFAALPRWERTALLLQAIDGWTGEQIAQVLDRPVATVYSDLSRGRARLREWLGDPR